MAEICLHGNVAHTDLLNSEMENWSFTSKMVLMHSDEGLLGCLDVSGRKNERVEIVKEISRNGFYNIKLL